MLTPAQMEEIRTKDFFDKISSYTMTKLNKDCPVNMEVMLNLCKVFHCDIGDLMEVIEE